MQTSRRGVDRGDHLRREAGRRVDDHEVVRRPQHRVDLAQELDRDRARLVGPARRQQHPGAPTRARRGRPRASPRRASRPRWRGRRSSARAEARAPARRRRTGGRGRPRATRLPCRGERDGEVRRRERLAGAALRAEHADHRRQLAVDAASASRPRLAGRNTPSRARTSPAPAGLRQLDRRRPPPPRRRGARNPSGAPFAEHHGRSGLTARRPRGRARARRREHRDRRPPAGRWSVLERCRRRPGPRRHPAMSHLGRATGVPRRGRGRRPRRGRWLP